jgi:hypothetical protein
VYDIGHDILPDMHVKCNNLPELPFESKCLVVEITVLAWVVEVPLMTWCTEPLYPSKRPLQSHKYNQTGYYDEERGHGVRGHGWQ